jgi:hypothetical protein
LLDRVQVVAETSLRWEESGWVCVWFSAARWWLWRKLFSLMSFTNNAPTSMNIF